jgi:hypothetical protein
MGEIEVRESDQGARDGGPWLIAGLETTEGADS